MKIILLAIGKTAFEYINDGIEIYDKRLQHYLPFEFKIIPEIKKSKKLTVEQVKKKEGELLLKSIPNDAYTVLLDVKSKTFTSEEFANFCNQRMVSGTKVIYFIIGGAYGFSQDVYNRAEYKISLSSMTMSHQLIRIVFLEQLYRAMTILKGEPYHH